MLCGMVAFGWYIVCIQVFNMLNKLLSQWALAADKMNRLFAVKGQLGTAKPSICDLGVFYGSDCFNLPLYKMVEPRVDPSDDECASSAVVPAVGDEGPQQVGMADVLPTITVEFVCCVSMVALLLFATDDDEAFAVGESPTTSISSSSSMTDVATMLIFGSVAAITTESVVSDNC